MFQKPATTIDWQIEKLRERGLTIQDTILAKQYLSNVSYYRLGEYWYVLQSDKENHIFKEGATFEKVIYLYEFDRELKVLLFDIIGQIEISLRAKMIYYLSHEFDPWWFQNFDIFIDSSALIKTLSGIEKEVSQSKEKTIKHHFEKYKEDLRLPPAWKTLEQTTFGTLSRLYGNLKNTVHSKNKIAKEFGVGSRTYLPSWLQSIAQIRNYCAHYSRLWNKNLTGTPKLLSHFPFDWIKNVPDQLEFPRLYIHLCIMKYLLNTIYKRNDFTQRLANLFVKYPNVDPNALGMKPNWQNEPLWKK